MSCFGAGFPTDQRGTYFRQFWDAGGDELPRPTQSVNPVSTSRGSLPGRQTVVSVRIARGAAVGQMVFSIRGDLLRRYPRAMVYALEGVWSPDGTRRELGTTGVIRCSRDAITGHHHARLSLTDDRFAGADNKAGGHPGWFFVLQEQPTEPRFGLDVATTHGGTPAHWRDLTWGNLGRMKPRSNRSCMCGSTVLLNNIVVDQIPWGKNRHRWPASPDNRRSAWRSMPDLAAWPAVGGEQHDIMPLLEQETATPNGPAGLGRTTDYVDDTTHRPAAGGDGGANPAHHGTERASPRPRRVALSGSRSRRGGRTGHQRRNRMCSMRPEPPQGIPATWRVRLPHRKKLVQAKPPRPRPTPR